MGSASSKATKTAASAAKRKYPQQASPATTNTPPRPPPGGHSGATVHPQPKARGKRDESINLDASDPQFAASLRSLGPVTPSSTLSNSSRFPPSPSSSSPLHSSSSSQQIFPNPSQNPAIQVLTARENLANAADAEFARVRYEGGGARKFLDVMTIRQTLMFRDEKGMGGVEIEKKLELAAGTVQRLGRAGIVGEAGMALS